MRVYVSKNFCSLDKAGIPFWIGFLFDNYISYSYNLLLTVHHSVILTILCLFLLTYYSLFSQTPLGDETITFNQEENIAIYRGDDGSFNLQDFGKVCVTFIMSEQRETL